MAASVRWNDGNNHMTKHYDHAYFDRWYRDPALKHQAIGGPARLARKVALAVATAEYHLERPIRSVLDIGCGEGAWRAPLLKLRPKLRYLGFDSSQYAIARHGAARNLHFASFGDFEHLRPCAPADLLVCSDVLHYLDARELDRGLPALAELCGGVAFLETFTRSDGIDGDTEGFRARPARFYRERFARVGLSPLGSHLWLAPSLQAGTAALELPG
jgi:SAM-dependent methyltransferase